MDKKKTRMVGSGITRREKVVPLPLDVEHVEMIINAFQQRSRTLNMPWGENKHLIDRARKKLKEVLAEAPSNMDDLDGHNAFFKERETVGWYVHSIDIAAKIAEKAVDEGRPWEAVSMGMEIGDLFAEMRFKELWEGFALKGHKLHENQMAGADERRKSSQQDRYDCVMKHYAEGHSLERCYGFASKKLGGSASAIKKDFLKKRKLDQSMD